MLNLQVPFTVIQKYWKIEYGNDITIFQPHCNVQAPLFTDVLKTAAIYYILQYNYILCYHSNCLMWLGVYFAYTPHQKFNCCFHSVVCISSWCICQIYHLLYSVQRFMWVYPLALWALGYSRINLLHSRWYICILLYTPPNHAWFSLNTLNSNLLY